MYINGWRHRERKNGIERDKVRRKIKMQQEPKFYIYILRRTRKHAVYPFRILCLHLAMAIHFLYCFPSAPKWILHTHKLSLSFLSISLSFSHSCRFVLRSNEMTSLLNSSNLLNGCGAFAMQTKSIAKCLNGSTVNRGRTVVFKWARERENLVMAHMKWTSVMFVRIVCIVALTLVYTLSLIWRALCDVSFAHCLSFSFSFVHCFSFVYSFISICKVRCHFFDFPTLMAILSAVCALFLEILLLYYHCYSDDLLNCNMQKMWIR